MSTKEARKRASTTYKKKHYRLAMKVPKGMREIYKAQAVKRAMSMNAYVTKLLEEA